MQYGQNATALTKKNKTNFQNKRIICIEGFSLFKKNSEYYCFADEEEFFWIHIQVPDLEINQIKIMAEMKKYFIVSDY